jgi:3-ketosteroid 9alpha-monooxygenase subunit B
MNVMAEQRVHRLRVAEVIRETADACSLVFEPEQTAGLAYRPGQFLTLAVPSDRCGSVARSYSLSSSPHVDRALKVTVKRAGYASNWICDNARPGAELAVLAPDGGFVPHSLDRDLLLFAAGSGITPIISILKSVLAAGRGRLALIYANRDESSVIFAAELADLARDHPDRLTVVHWLESLQGLPSQAALRALTVPYTDREIFICGPKAFMDTAVAAMRELGVGRGRLRLELFTSLTANPFAAESGSLAGPPFQATPDARRPRAENSQPATGPASLRADTTVEVELDGERHTLTWPPNVRLLDVLLDHGVDAPYSCREGSCGACACRVLEGEIAMARAEALDEEDLAEGWVLACQSTPLTEQVQVTYT